METIIGLGKAGCNIAEKFSQFPQYKIYKIDSEHRDGHKFKKIESREDHEEYEVNCPPLDDFFCDIEGPCLFVVAGGGKISGLSLRVLEHLKQKDLYILYIKPDMSLLSEEQRLNEKVVFGVLQEYARSAVFERMFIANNLNIEEIIGNMPVIGYYDKLNETLVSTIHMINVFKNSISVMDTFSTPGETSRISTIGFVDIDSGKEKLFYDLEYPREKLYYYAINQRQLQEESNLLKKITSQVKENSKGEEIKPSYGIYSTNYEANYGYVVVNSTLIQEQIFT